MATYQDTAIASLSGSSPSTGAKPSFRPIAANTIVVPADDHAIATAFPRSSLDEPIAKAWAEHQRLVPHYRQAIDEEAALVEREQSDRPKLPVALRARDDDFPGDSIRFITETIDGERYYSTGVIEHLRKSRRLKPALVGLLESSNDRDQFATRVPDPEGQKRADEIVAAWDQWTNDCIAHRIAMGLDAATERAEGLETEIDAVNDVIRDTPALSLKGLGLKASWGLSSLFRTQEDQKDVLHEVEAFALGQINGDAALIDLCHELETAWAAERVCETDDEDEVGNVYERSAAIAERINATPAHGVTGLYVKFRACMWVQSIFDPEVLSPSTADYHERILASMSADFRRQVGHTAMPTQAHASPTEDRKVA